MSVSLEQEADGTLNQDNISMLAKGIIHKGVDRLLRYHKGFSLYLGLKG